MRVDQHSIHPTHFDLMLEPIPGFMCNGSLRRKVSGFAFWLFVCALGARASLTPVALRCEYLVNPIGLDEKVPRLTWRVESNAHAQKQTAYRILVSSSEKALAEDKGDLWESGKVSSDETVNVTYAGKPLDSRQTCFWKVQVWDGEGKSSAWSVSAFWTMGLLEPSDWKAEFISFRDKSPLWSNKTSLFLPPARQYRRDFPVSKAVRKATAYATALGIYELHLNGKRVGDAFFAPGWCDYRKRLYYNTYDVTSLVTNGPNAIGAWVADGWYSGYLGFGLLVGIGSEAVGRYTYGKTPALRLQLEIDYTDGSREVVATDRSWKVSGDGPIREADFLMGESYDARREMAGWSTAGFSDSEWESAIPAQENGTVQAKFFEFENPASGEPAINSHEVNLGFKEPPKLDAFPGVPVRQLQELRPVAITSPSSGVHIFDLGQNIAGVVRLRVKGPAGNQIRLRYGEMLHPDGRLMTENLRKARATDFYTLRGDPQGESWTPRFTFHGFQYVELTGFPGKPELDSITGLGRHSDTPLTSDFECSDPMVNRLFKNVVWTQRANFVDLPTDCPQRDERFGWTGDAQTYVRTATYNADVAAFYTKWIRELMESQRPSGTFPGYAPFPFQHGWDFGTAWCDAGVICPWTIYKAYADKRIIERCWEPMTKFIAWRKTTSKGFLGVKHGNQWGDWLALNETTPFDYIDTCYFAYSTKLMAEMADAIGKTEQATEYRELFDKIKVAFTKKYLKPDATLAVDTQTAYSLALFVGLIAGDQRNAAAAHLAEKIRVNQGRMSTGFLGTRPLLPVLSACEQNDLAVQLLQSRKFPSWGYEVEQGATTIWERWNSYTKDKGFGGEQNAAMNSFSHYAFGAVCEWLFSGLAGIDTDAAGFRHIVIRPMPPAPGSNPDQKPIHWVKAHYDSIHGRIATSWRMTTNRFELDVTIPANTTATVYLPSKDSNDVTENGRALSESRLVRLEKFEGGRAVLAVPSGTYQFTSGL
jgi:alpha-L-rhamnosidase